MNNHFADFATDALTASGHRGGVHVIVINVIFVYEIVDATSRDAAMRKSLLFPSTILKDATSFTKRAAYSFVEVDERGTMYRR